MTENSHLLHTYNKHPITLTHGKGVYVYDEAGKEYIDFVAGIAVSSLGYAHQELNEALKEQIDKMVHTSNLYHNETCDQAATALADASGMDKIFFCNSGAEATEGALKAARKYAVQKGTGRFEFIAMKEAFHGRTMGALSVTGRTAYRTPFEPLIPHVSFADYNDLNSVKACITDQTCAIIVEPIQGEGGIYAADQEFLQGIRKLCDEHDIVLIFDEIQCGMGRTGHMFAWQGYGVKPDIITMAKALGNGLPVGAFGVTEKLATLSPGDHGTTYGGNPLVCRAICKILELFAKENLVEHVRIVGAYLTEQLEKIVAEYDCVAERRGIGLMQGLVLTVKREPVIEKAVKEGLLVIGAGENVIRIVPPLIITTEQIDEGIQKLRRALFE